MHKRARLGLLGVLGAVALATTSWVMTAGLASAASGPDTVTICHATSSDGNPYIVETPDKDGDVSGHADHTGPIWTSDLKDQHIQWGDIIPPFDFEGGSFPGLNWDAYGQATWNAGCVPTLPPTTTLAPQVVTTTTGAPAVAADVVTVSPRFTG
jgi:hypothetical protein